LRLRIEILGWASVRKDTLKGRRGGAVILTR
jgi:hypothetical protein